MQYLDGVVKTIKARVENEKPIAFSKLEQMVKKEPENPELQAKMAYEHFTRRDNRLAGAFATKALELKPHQPLASYVLARLKQSIGDESAALEIIEPAFDPKEPNERVIDLLGELKMKAGKLDEAEKLFEIARQQDPQLTKWIAHLARVHSRQSVVARKNGDEAAAAQADAKFLNDLAMIADNNADDLDMRRALAETHLSAGHMDEAEKWAMECLYVDVYDPNNHMIAASMFTARKKFEDAIEEYQMAHRIEGEEAQQREGEARQGEDRRGQDRGREGHDRRRAQVRPRASRGPGSSRGDEEGQVTRTELFRWRPTSSRPCRPQPRGTNAWSSEGSAGRAIRPC